jgi:NAD(P)-dependent dehydrogenase (short-subunit alcohol dehydrogenase family)
MTDREIDHRGAVVITGTSTGIGAACARLLAGEGFAVFAGVRRHADAKAIEDDTSGAMTPLMMDITDADMIASAARTVADTVADRGLAGIVNNAGIVRPGPLEFQPMSEFREQLEVNLFGHVAVTQAFLPLIRQGKGRIVNVGSIGGRLVLPLHGGYSASKFAMEAITDALRLELRQWGIHVCLIDPGGSKSAIFVKTLAAIDEMKQELHDRGIDVYDAQIDAVRALVVKTADDADPADRVARAVVDALTAKRPKTRYLAGKDAKAVAVLARTLPDRLKDLAVAHEAGLPEYEK